MLPTEVLPTKTISSKRTGHNIDDASLYSQANMNTSPNALNEQIVISLLTDENEYRLPREVKHRKKPSGSIYGTMDDSSSVEEYLAAKVNRSFNRSIKALDIPDKIEEAGQM